MNLQRNYYEVLGVSPNATTQEIKTKYRELARKFHPDLVKDKALGVKVFSQVNQAYRILADPDRRRDYDDQQTAHSSKAKAAKANLRSAAASGSTATMTQPHVDRHAARPVLSETQMAQLARSLNLADNSIMEGQADQARQLCEAVLRIDPQNGRALGILGDAYAALMRKEAAVKAYKLAMEISPSSMIEAKLRRLEQAAVQASTEKAPQKPTPSSSETNGGGSLFGKLMGRNKK
jgi:curved DNA-binding protein CbpA